MKKKHEKPVAVISVGLIALTIIFAVDLDSNLLAFSDGTSLKSGTGQNLQLAKAYIGYDIKTQDGNTISSQLQSTDVVFGKLSFVLDDGGVTLVDTAEFVTYVDMSRLGQDYCFDHPRIGMDQTVYVNGQITPMHKQIVSYNELDPNTFLLKTSGLKITPLLFDQVLNLKTGDEIQIQFDTTGGRFEAHLIDKVESGISKVTDAFCQKLYTDIGDPVDSRFVTESYDGFVTSMSASYTFIYVDPIDILLGNYPPSETEHPLYTGTDPVTEQCPGSSGCDYDGDGINDPLDVCPDSGEVFNGYQDNDGCPDTIPEAEITGFTCDPTSPNYDQQICEELESVTSNNSCITLYDPVCGTDGKTYGNSCFAEQSGQTTFAEGTCDDIEEQPVVTDVLPDTDDGVVGICNPEIEDCDFVIMELENQLTDYTKSIPLVWILALIIIIATIIGFIVVVRRRK